MRGLIHDIRNDLNLLELEVAILEQEIEKGNARLEDLGGTRETLRNAEFRLRKLSRRFQPVSPVLTTAPIAELLENVQRLAQQARYIGPTDIWEPSITKSMISADFDLLSEAILEVLENGAQFRPEGTPISLFTTTDAHDLKITIQEIKVHPPDNFEVWGEQPFATTQRGSYGLGLYHAARIVTAHHGRIVRAFHPASGIFQTTFILPLIRPKTVPVQR